MNPLKEEFIGREMEVVTSRHSPDEAIKGVIMDETMHTIDVLHDGTITRLMKANIVFRVGLSDGWHEIAGNAIEHRPEERIKKVK
ncbi:MAG: ribonuclease P protein subunit [Nanoarchaeota archaeon]